MGDLERLSLLLDRLHRLGRITSRLPIYVTEYGYETNPPDVVRGVSLKQQARYHGLATFMAWKQHDVSLVRAVPAQRHRAAPGTGSARRRSRDWHSGLYFHDGQAEARGRGLQAAVLGGVALARGPERGRPVRAGAAERGPQAD